MSLLKIPLLQLKRKKFRTAILIVSIMLALSLLIGLNAGVDGLQKTYYNLVGDSLGYTDLIVKSNTTTPAFSTETFESILNDGSVAAYSYRVQYWLPFASVDGRFNGTNGGYLVGINPETDENFGSYKITVGNCTSISEALSDSNGACVLGESFARTAKLKRRRYLDVGLLQLQRAHTCTAPTNSQSNRSLHNTRQR